MSTGVAAAILDARPMEANVDHIRSERSRMIRQQIVDAEADLKRSAHQFENIVAQPVGTAKFHNVQKVARQCRKEMGQPFQIALPSAWQLIEHRSQRGPEPSRRSRDPLDRLPGSFSFFMCVRNRLAFTAYRNDGWRLSAARSQTPCPKAVDRSCC